MVGSYNVSTQNRFDGLGTDDEAEARPSESTTPKSRHGIPLKRTRNVVQKTVSIKHSQPGSTYESRPVPKKSVKLPEPERPVASGHQGESEDDDDQEINFKEMRGSRNETKLRPVKDKGTFGSGGGAIKTKRVFDRHSGTGRGKEIKRKGAGKHNWGADTGDNVEYIDIHGEGLESRPRSASYDQRSGPETSEGPQRTTQQAFKRRDSGGQDRSESVSATPAGAAFADQEKGGQTQQTVSQRKDVDDTASKNYKPSYQRRQQHSVHGDQEGGQRQRGYYSRDGSDYGRHHGEGRRGPRPQQQDPAEKEEAHEQQQPIAYQNLDLNDQVAFPTLA